MFSVNFAAEWAGRMINGMVEGVLIALIAWAVIWVAGRQNSQTRFAVWFAALVGIAIMPFVRFGGISSAAGSNAHFTLPMSWAMFAVGIWIFIATILLVRVAVGLFELQKIRREAKALDSSLLTQTHILDLQKFSAGRNIQLLVSSNVRVPTAVGFFNPAVIFPEWTLKELSAQQQNVVLLHELAHLRRFDDWTNLAQQILKAVFFFHPAVWWIERRLTLEREMACDHFVLTETKNPQAYAECLVSMAEKNFLRRGLALAQAMVGRVKQTSLRVTEILNRQSPKSSRIYKPAFAMLAVFAFASAGEIRRMPELVAFEADAPQATSSSSPIAMPAMHITPTLTSYKIAKPKSVVQPAAKARINRPSIPLVEPTLASLEIDSIAPPEFMAQPVFLVMQTQQFGPEGEIYWSLQIYQLTVYHTAVPPMQKENQGKQI